MVFNAFYNTFMSVRCCAGRVPAVQASQLLFFFPTHNQIKSSLHSLLIHSFVCFLRVAEVHGVRRGGDRRCPRRRAGASSLLLYRHAHPRNDTHDRSIDPTIPRRPFIVMIISPDHFIVNTVKIIRACDPPTAHPRTVSWALRCLRRRCIILLIRTGIAATKESFLST